MDGASKVHALISYNSLFGAHICYIIVVTELVRLNTIACLLFVEALGSLVASAFAALGLVLISVSLHPKSVSWYQKRFTPFVLSWHLIVHMACKECLQKLDLTLLFLWKFLSIQRKWYTGNTNIREHNNYNYVYTHNYTYTGNLNRECTRFTCSIMMGLYW